MIKFSLVCDTAHAFESWFASGSAYDEQTERGLVHCPVCQSEKVTKAIMAPAIASHRRRELEDQALQSQALKSQAPQGEASRGAAVEGHAISGREQSRVIEGEIIAPSQPIAAEQMPPALLDAQQREIRAIIGAMRTEIMANTVDVGKSFPDEARKMHDGDSPERPIRGEATAEEIHALIEDGVKIIPVPPAPEELN